MFKFHENSTKVSGKIDSKYIIDKLLKLKNDNNDDQFSSYLNNVAHTFSENFKKIWKNYIFNKRDAIDYNFKFFLRYSHPNFRFSTLEGNDYYRLSLRGDGLKKFTEFMLSAATDIHFDEISNTLFILDEPETNFHPSAAKDFRDELIKISEHNNNYVIYATHSVSMMERDSLSHHYIVRRKNRVTSITSAEDFTISQNKIQHVLEYEFLYNEVGYSTYENFKEKNIIFEGWTDKKLFVTYLSGENIDFGVTHAWGVNTMKNISPILELSQRSFLIVSDCDNNAKQQQKKYNSAHGYGKWLLYTEINDQIIATTAEDFLKIDFIVEQVKLYLTNNKEYFKDGEVKFTKENLSHNPNKKRCNCKKIEKEIVKHLKENNCLEIMGGIKKQMFKALKYENIIDEYKILYDGIIKELDLLPPKK